jgi:hypothetical protein
VEIFHPYEKDISEKNYGSLNLIVFSTDDFENQLDFEKVDSVLRKIISTLFLFEVKEQKS